MMTDEQYLKSKQIAFWICRGKNPDHRFSDDELEDLHSQAWLDLLAWEDRKGIDAFLTAKLLAEAMHRRFIKSFKRQNQREGWHEKFLLRLKIEKYHRGVVNNLLDGAPSDTRQVMKLRLQGYPKRQIAEFMKVSPSTVARRIADFTEIALAA